MRLVADENFNNDILRGVARRMPGADFVRVQDVGLAGATDEEILHWAAVEERVIVTHDVATMGPRALNRIERGLHVAGVFQIARAVSVL